MSLVIKQLKYIINRHVNAVIDEDCDGNGLNDWRKINAQELKYSILVQILRSLYLDEKKISVEPLSHADAD